MMNVLLKYLQLMPLTQAAVEAFLLRVAKLVIVREITLDDWVYLAHLVAYRATTRLGATDDQKAILAKLMHRITEDKDGLSSMFN